MAASNADQDALPPMPTPNFEPLPSLTSFKVLSFDIYGTLIDFENSIFTYFKPLIELLPHDHPSKSITPRVFATTFNEHESPILHAHPDSPYYELIQKVYISIAESWSLDTNSPEVKEGASKFGASIASWKPFPDTIDAIQRLAKYYHLVPLSNVDRVSFDATLKGELAPCPFWRTFVASDIGSYKPDLRNFEYLLKHVDKDDRGEGGKGVKKEEFLHVAQSLTHDHVPAKKMGLNSAWIARRGLGYGGSGKELHDRNEVGYGWRFRTLGELADLVERTWREEGKEKRY